MNKSKEGPRSDPSPPCPDRSKDSTGVSSARRRVRSSSSTFCLSLPIHGLRNSCSKKIGSKIHEHRNGSKNTCNHQILKIRSQQLLKARWDLHARRLETKGCCLPCLLVRLRSGKPGLGGTTAPTIWEEASWA